MTPEMQTTIPPHIKSVIERLSQLNDELSRDAAALISAFVAQAAPDHITVCLQSNTVMRGGLTVSLSPNQTVVLHLLAEKYPAVASVQEMHRALYGPTADRSVNTVRVMVTNLRQRLEPLNVLIQNRNGIGYKLELLPPR